MDSGPQGERVAVGGASRGLARAIAESLDSEGCDLLLWARGPDGLGGVASDPTSRYGVRTECVPEGAGHKDAEQTIAIAAVNFFRAVDILVPNAGGPPPVSPTATAPSVWRIAFQLFCITPVEPATCLLPAMPASRWGRIVAVLSSGVGVKSMTWRTPTPHGALLQLGVKTASARVSQDGVTNNGILPEP